MTEETAEEKLARYEFVIDAYVRELTALREENERLRSAAGAHDVLRSIYSDINQPTGHRLKAAGLALGHESAPLKPVEAPLDLVAEPVIPLAELVTMRRKHVDHCCASSRKLEYCPAAKWSCSTRATTVMAVTPLIELRRRALFAAAFGKSLGRLATDLTPFWAR